MDGSSTCSNPLDSPPSVTRSVTPLADPAPWPLGKAFVHQEPSAEGMGTLGLGGRSGSLRMTPGGRGLHLHLSLPL